MADQQSTVLSLDPPVPPNTYLPTLFSGAPVAPPGTPLAALVAVGQGGKVAQAKADSGDSTYVVALAAIVGIPGRPVHAQYGGPLTLTTDEWDLITGESGGLENGAPYYLSAATSGKLTKVLPGAGFAAPVGIALSLTTLMINIAFPSVIIP